MSSENSPTQPFQPPHGGENPSGIQAGPSTRVGRSSSAPPRPSMADAEKEQDVAKVKNSAHMHGTTIVVASDDRSMQAFASFVTPFVIPLLSGASINIGQGSALATAVAAATSGGDGGITINPNRPGDAEKQLMSTLRRVLIAWLRDNPATAAQKLKLYEMVEGLQVMKKEQKKEETKLNKAHKTKLEENRKAIAKEFARMLQGLKADDTNTEAIKTDAEVMEAANSKEFEWLDAIVYDGEMIAKGITAKGRGIHLSRPKAEDQDEEEEEEEEKLAKQGPAVKKVAGARKKAVAVKKANPAPSNKRNPRSQTAVTEVEAAENSDDFGKFDSEPEFDKFGVSSPVASPAVSNKRGRSSSSSSSPPAEARPSKNHKTRVEAEAEV